jgi:hypothetical protein
MPAFARTALKYLHTIGKHGFNILSRQSFGGSGLNIICDIRILWDRKLVHDSLYKTDSSPNSSVRKCATSALISNDNLREKKARFSNLEDGGRQ